jgi:hypothetical protein
MAGHAGQPEPEKPEKTPDGRVPMKEILGSVTVVVSIISSAAFVLSFIYEQAYFSVVGKKFQSIASLSDYLANALDWLPAVVALLIAYWIGMLLLAMMMGKTLSRPVDASPSKEDKSYNWVTVLMVLVLVGVDAHIYLFTDPASGLWGTILISAPIWMFIVAFAVSRSSGLEALIGTNTKLFMFFVPLFAGGAYVLGLQAAYRDLGPAHETYSLTRKDSLAQAPEDVSVLRTFERGILVRLPKQQVSQFLRWDEIRLISLPRDGEAGKSLGCRQLGLFCRAPAAQ